MLQESACQTVPARVEVVVFREPLSARLKTIGLDLSALHFVMSSQQFDAVQQTLSQAMGGPDQEHFAPGQASLSPGPGIPSQPQAFISPDSATQAPLQPQAFVSPVPQHSDDPPPLQVGSSHVLPLASTPGGHFADPRLLDRLEPQLKYDLEVHDVPEQVQAAIASSGFVTRNLFAMLGDDRAQVREILAEPPFNLNPRAPGMRVQATLAQAKVLDAWESVRVTVHEERKAKAAQRAGGIPITQTVSKHVAIRKSYEEQHGRTRDNEFPDESVIERRLQEVENGDLKADPLEEVLSREEGAKDSVGPLLTGSWLDLKSLTKTIKKVPHANGLRGAPHPHWLAGGFIRSGSEASSDLHLAFDVREVSLGQPSPIRSGRGRLRLHRPVQVHVAETCLGPGHCLRAPPPKKGHREHPLRGHGLRSRHDQREIGPRAAQSRISNPRHGHHARKLCRSILLSSTRLVAPIQLFPLRLHDQIGSIR